MKSILLIYALTVIVALSQDKEQSIPVEFRTTLGKVVTDTEWPGKVSRIIAVTYDYQKEKSEDVVVDGRLHKGVFLTSKDLTAEQTKKLYSAITGTNVHFKGSACFLLHHGFIFYGDNDKILGSITICFSCNNYHHAPAGELSKVFDLDGLEKLVVELKMPLSNDPKAYPSLFKKNEEAQKVAPPNRK